MFACQQMPRLLLAILLTLDEHTRQRSLIHFLEFALGRLLEGEEVAARELLRQRAATAASGGAGGDEAI